MSWALWGSQHYPGPSHPLVCNPDAFCPASILVGVRWPWLALRSRSEVKSYDRRCASSRLNQRIFLLRPPPEKRTPKATHASMCFAVRCSLSRCDTAPRPRARKNHSMQRISPKSVLPHPIRPGVRRGTDQASAHHSLPARRVWKARPPAEPVYIPTVPHKAGVREQLVTPTWNKTKAGVCESTWQELCAALYRGVRLLSGTLYGFLDTGESRVRTCGRALRGGEMLSLFLLFASSFLLHPFLDFGRRTLRDSCPSTPI